MSNINVEIVQELLKGATKPEVVNRLVAPEAIYVSLTYDNPDLKKLMPWAGTHKDGPASVLKVFQELNTFWMIEDLEVQDAFGEGENVALFGTFTTHSVKLDKKFTSPFVFFAKVKNGLVTYMQYMEDTFGTGSTFRSGGTWTFQGNPDGSEVSVP
ncbi:nuclear transport factor 2 family protein [Nostoc sp. PA-18-2419]|uniref:nuclear transport factor 2 family protein n=1 Tax=Nostoc sp. PA-18-2419 TaxID=2575443 RepID=UPI001109BC5B|nr:nuclear transport factor 2 family protein [Nostoc sp. PA-18-2419]